MIIESGVFLNASNNLLLQHNSNKYLVFDQVLVEFSEGNAGPWLEQHAGAPLDHPVSK